MIKTLLKSVRQYKTASILTPLFVSLEVILECLIPLVMIQLIDQIYGGKLSIIMQFGIILLVMALVSLIFGALSGKYCATASAGFAKNLRFDLFKKVQDFSFSNIDRFSSSSLVTRLTTDVTNVQTAYMMIIRIAVRCPLMLVFSFAMSLSISVKMSLIFAVAIPVLGIALFVIMKLVYPIFERAFVKYDHLNNSVQENIKGMRVVKSYVREDFEQKKFEARTEDVRKDFDKASKMLALIGPIMQFCIYAVILALSAIGAYLIVTTFGGFDENGKYIWGELSTGQLSSLITYSTQILSSLLMLSMVLVMISMSKASAQRIVEVLNEKSDIVAPENPVFDVEGGDIEFNNVSFKYAKNAERNALENINLKIKSGETVGILGGTGSSKTTLVQLICRLYDTTEGEVTVGGKNVKQYDLDALRNAVAFVLQKNILFAGSVKENLKWGNAFATDEQMIEACKSAQAHDFIMSFTNGYDSKIEQGGANVSGGQKQRLCIARALLKNPKIIIFDDSTSAVDTKTDAFIRSALKKAIPNTTKIMIAQRVASVMDADQIIVMDKGTVVSKGTHEQLLQNCDIYKEVYDSQNKAGEQHE